MFLATNN